MYFFQFNFCLPIVLFCESKLLSMFGLIIGEVTLKPRRNNSEFSSLYIKLFILNVVSPHFEGIPRLAIYLPSALVPQLHLFSALKYREPCSKQTPYSSLLLETSTVSSSPLSRLAVLCTLQLHFVLLLVKLLSAPLSTVSASPNV